MEIAPDIQLNKYKGFEVQKEVLDLSEERVVQALEGMRRNFPEFSSILEDRLAQMGDAAEIDFDGFVNGEPLEGGKAEGHRLELGSHSFIPGFEEEIVGMKVGDEKEIHLEFPTKYHQAEIAGKPVVFKVKLHGLFKKSFPELNDELASKMGLKTLDELRSFIRNDMKRVEERRIQEDLEHRLLEALVENNPVEIPGGLFSSQKSLLISQKHQQMKSRGISDEEFKEYKVKNDKHFEKMASFIIQSSFLVEYIAKEFEIRTVDEDLFEELRRQAEIRGVNQEELVQHYKDEEKRAQLFYQVKKKKVLEFLFSEAHVVEAPRGELKPSQYV